MVCYANVVICVAIFHKFSSLVAFVNDVAIFVQFVGFCSHAFRTRDGHHAIVRIQSCLPVFLTVQDFSPVSVCQQETCHFLSALGVADD